MLAYHTFHVSLHLQKEEDKGTVVKLPSCLFTSLRHSVHTSQETHYVSATKINRFILCRETIVVYRWEPLRHTHSVGRMQSSSMLGQAVYTVTTGIWRDIRHYIKQDPTSISFWVFFVCKIIPTRSTNQTYRELLSGIFETRFVGVHVDVAAVIQIGYFRACRISFGRSCQVPRAARVRFVSTHSNSCRGRQKWSAICTPISLQYQPNKSINSYSDVSLWVTYRPARKSRASYFYCYVPGLCDRHSRLCRVISCVQMPHASHTMFGDFLFY
jgi:hypothetical protein